MIWIITILIFALLFWQAKISVDFSSFLRSTIPLDRGLFGVYCFTGKQGSGKTYSLVKYIKKHSKKNQIIYSNIHMIGVNYKPITSIQHFLSLKDKKNLYIVYDEIFTLLADKTIPKDIREELMEFLTQQRKMKNILFTTAQEWLEIPVTFRRFVRIQIDCKTLPLGKFGGLLMEEYFDAYEMKWSQLDNEYIAPRLSKKISKYEKRFMQSYDTFERIRKLQKNDRPVAPSNGAQAP